ncbi:DMT family transporter [Photobacterium sp. WH77]|uniref:DMT family transporter n=1 Tax=unclassified Photobacterium TaxID=2628852 RepID=UPI001C493F87|nr:MULTISPECIES: DMT family transporter [unclassified Photobacterium]MBV7262657.1 DMT family transporter [Photobacterium sp. WH24]MCG2837786.1 DMT family transporter [Photobacterium sp. WH77]MCG2845402.1 DMT family transporter [Photobacterium sp. WH80]MDO6582184.1 DMT family transporter [Photobacterium sp. 2_MG-2023]
MNKGVMFVLTFDVLSAAQSVWLGSLLQGVKIYNILFVNFAIISLTFALMNHFNKKDKATITIKDSFLFLVLNIGTLGSWLFLYISLKYIEPALTAATIYGINPLATLLVSLIVWKAFSELSKAKLFVSILTIGCMVIVGLTVTGGYSSVTNDGHHELTLGFIMAIMTGFCMAIVNVISKKIYENGFNLYQLMSMRFFLLLVVSFYMGSNIVNDIQEHAFAFVVIAILGNVIPLFMLQKGIALIPPRQVSYLLLLTPLFVFLFQYFDSRLQLSFYSLLAIMSVVVLSVLGSYIESRKKEKIILKEEEAR